MQIIRYVIRRIEEKQQNSKKGMAEIKPWTFFALELPFLNLISDISYWVSPM